MATGLENTWRIDQMPQHGPFPNHITDSSVECLSEGLHTLSFVDSFEDGPCARPSSRLAAMPRSSSPLTAMPPTLSCARTPPITAAFPSAAMPHVPGALPVLRVRP